MYSEAQIDILCQAIKHNNREWDKFDKGMIKIKPKSFDEVINQFKNK